MSRSDSNFDVAGWIKKLAIAYGICLGLSVLAAYLDRNDPSGSYLTPVGVVFETVIFSFLLFFIFGIIFGIIKLINLGIRKILQSIKGSL